MNNTIKPVSASEFVQACRWLLRESDSDGIFEPEPEIPKPRDEAIVEVLNIAKEMNIGATHSKGSGYE